MSLTVEVETSRLVLRQWRAADRKPFAALNGDPQVTQFLLPLTAQESDALADRLAAGIDEHGWGFWAVEAPGVAPFIGFVGIKPLASSLPFGPGVEIGWRLAQPFWGRGYASEAADAALRVGFEQVGADEIVAFTAIGNQRSRAVMDRLGMTADAGSFDHPAVPAGHPLRPHVLYRIARASWRRQQDGNGARDGEIFPAA